MEQTAHTKRGRHKVCGSKVDIIIPDTKYMQLKIFAFSVIWSASTRFSFFTVLLCILISGLLWRAFYTIAASSGCTLLIATAIITRVVLVNDILGIGRKGQKLFPGANPLKNGLGLEGLIGA